jgi:DtxR family transcriptional regulator, Mn-dependent transcriptional regulator
MASETVENYLKAIYALAAEAVPAGAKKGEAGKGEAGLGKLAAVLGVTAGTATTMVRKLAVDRLVKYERYGGVRLTAKGTSIAVDVLRRHRLIETFLVQTLGFDWSEVHEEAERLEHAVSPKLLARLEDFLGRPRVDPHGDPIPTATGAMQRATGVTMAAAAVAGGASHKKRGTYRILRVSDQNAEFLKFIADRGLKPGTRGIRLAVDADAGLVTVRVEGGGDIALSLGVAGRIVVVGEGATG